MKPSCLLRVCLITALVASLVHRQAPAADWPMFGRDATRNPVSPEKDPPADWNVGKIDRENGRWIQDGARNVKWVARLGSVTCGDPVVADGLVWVGTNNYQLWKKTDPQQDASLLACFRASDGQQLYQYVSPRLPHAREQDWPFSSMACSPLVEGDRLWFVTNRWETVCLDIGPLKRGDGEPRIIWKCDLIKELGVFPRGAGMIVTRHCMAAAYKDRIFVITGNGVDRSSWEVPAPEAPSLVCCQKESGEVLWQDNSPGANILNGQWASPLVVEINGRGQVITPQGDGWVRSFDAMTGELIWKFDMNYKESKWDIDHTNCTRNNILATPVFYNNRVYLASGQQDQRGDGPGRLCCIDPTREGDISSELAIDHNGNQLPQRRVQAVDPANGEKAIPNPNSGLIWEYTELDQDGNGRINFEETFNRTLCSVAIKDDLLVAGDYRGLVYCFDAQTGQRYWSYDTFGSIYSPPLIVDGKVFVTANGDVAIFNLSADPNTAMEEVDGILNPINTVSMGNSVYVSPVFVNGTLYIATAHHLFAMEEEKPQDDRGQGDWPQWRGPNRDNVSSDVGLLDLWPEHGPPLVWRVKGLGDGISPPSIAGRRIFTISQNESTEYVRALNQQTGEHLWTVEIGPAPRQGQLMRWLTQRPPTIDGDFVYAVSLSGELVCLNASDGREIWRHNYPRDFLGRCGVFGYSDCPLVDGDKLICTPGGPQATVVALDKATGNVLWACDVPDSARAAYSNGVIAELGGKRQFVTFLENALVAMGVEDGELLWRLDNANDVIGHPHTPIIHDRRIVCIDGGRNRLKLLEVKRNHDEFSIKEVYSVASGPFARYSDDTALVEDHIYETNLGIITCVDLKRGSSSWRNRLAGGATTATYAQGHLYLHASDGTLKLIELTAERPVVKSVLTLPDHQNSMGTTTPIVTGGRLYVREDDQLFCYDVRKDASRHPSSRPQTVQLASVEATLRPSLSGFWPQWRGPNRDNVSQETGLLDRWPEGGPPLAWRVEGLGQGIASVSIADGHIYTTTYNDGKELVVCLDHTSGALVWAKSIGAAIRENPLMRWLSQRTPTIDGDRLYLLTAEGKLVCLSVNDGSEKWRKSYVEEFGGEQGVWGFCDFPLVDGDNLICVPGGKQASMVALNKFTGETIWECGSFGRHHTSYAATLVLNVDGIHQYANYLGGSLAGVAADDGRLLWRREVSDRFFSLTPLAVGDRRIYAGSQPLSLFTLVSNDDHISVQEVYPGANYSLDPFQDNVLCDGEHVFATARFSVRERRERGESRARRGRRGIVSLLCIALKDGQPVWKQEASRAATVYADGHLYLRSSAGLVTLVEASADKYTEKGRFEIPDHQPASGATTPVIAGGHLYLRDDDKLFAYDIRQGTTGAPRPASKTVTLNLAAKRSSDVDRDSEPTDRPGPRSVFVPTPQDVVEEMLAAANVTQEDLVYDLGSGDGRIVITAAKKHSCHAVGYEIDPELVELSRAKAREERVDDLVRFKKADIFTVDLTEADVIALYLLPQQLEKLVPQLQKLKRGSRIVSHQFEIPGIKADKTLEVESASDGEKHTTYLYFWTTPVTNSK